MRVAPAERPNIAGGSAPRSRRSFASAKTVGNRSPQVGSAALPAHDTANADRLRAHQVEEMARRRASGDHPSQRPEVRARIAEAQRAPRTACRGSSGGGFTGLPSEFRRLILPRLDGLPPRELAGVTGLSPGYCAQIRDGKRIPHVRHWPAFQLAGSRPTMPANERRDHLPDQTSQSSPSRNACGGESRRSHSRIGGAYVKPG